MILNVLPAFFDIKLSNIIVYMFQLLTLLLAYRIYKNLDIRKTHVNKQLSAVHLLVEDINACQIPVNFWTKIPQVVLDKLPANVEKYKSTLESWHFTLFTIAGFSNAMRNFTSIYLSADPKNVMPFL